MNWLTSANLGDYVRDLAARSPNTTSWSIEAARLETLVGALTWLLWQFTIENSPELEALLRDLSGRWRSPESGVPATSR